MKLFYKFLFFFLVFSSCNNKQNTISDNSKKSATPKPIIDTKNATKFLNDYVALCNKQFLRKAPIDIDSWVENNALVTKNFKEEYKKIIAKAKADDPELGLDFDPILDAQDYPDKGFEISEINHQKNFVTYKGVGWNEFTLKVKIIYFTNKWLVDGIGIVNIEEKDRCKHK